MEVEGWNGKFAMREGEGRGEQLKTNGWRERSGRIGRRGWFEGLEVIGEERVGR